MFEQIWQALKPIILEIIQNPVFAGIIGGAIVAMVTTILTLLKVPAWLIGIIVKIIKNLLHITEKVEKRSANSKMTSDEKLQMAIKMIDQTEMSKDEKEVLKKIGAKTLIEDVVLPIQKFPHSKEKR